MAAETGNPFSSTAKELEVEGQKFTYFDIGALGGDKLARLPYSVRVLLESAVRNCDNFHVRKEDVTRILDWETNRSQQVEIPFRPARVILQDFTGVPAVVDFAAMRDAVKRLGGDPDKINPVCPTDLVIDHSVQVDVSRSTLASSFKPMNVARTPNPGGGRTGLQSKVVPRPTVNTSRSSASVQSSAFSSSSSTIGLSSSSSPSFSAPGIRGEKATTTTTRTTTILSTDRHAASSSVADATKSESLPGIRNVNGGGGCGGRNKAVPWRSSTVAKKMAAASAVAYASKDQEAKHDDSVMANIISNPLLRRTVTDPGISNIKNNNDNNNNIGSNTSSDLLFPASSAFSSSSSSPPSSSSSSRILSTSNTTTTTTTTSSTSESTATSSRSILPKSTNPSSFIMGVCGGSSSQTSSLLSLSSTTSLLTTQQSSSSSSSSSSPSCCLCSHSSFPVHTSQCPFHLLPTQGGDALEKNQELEFERNKERFVFLKWGAKALRNMFIVPPGSGIVHQVNLEYLARVVFTDGGVLYPDSLVGTDSHTTMINGLGVLGWGVGGIEAEAVMLGQAISMVLPEVVGYRLVGSLDPLVTSTDVVLTITKHLRQIGVVGKFVEFFGPGVSSLSIADRATISNMCPEYGATTGFFAVDDMSLEYLRQTGRDSAKIAVIEAYLKANHLFRDFSSPEQDPVFSEIVELDLSTVVPCCSGPKRPHDKVAVAEMKADFNSCLNNKVGFKGYAIPPEKQTTTVPFIMDNQEYVLRHGSVVIAAITSCTNTSNPSVMLAAGLLAQKAVEAGLSIAPYIKTSLSPGSGVVTYYLQESGVTPYLEKLGFNIVGYGCMTCIGNSGPLPDEVAEAIEKGDLVACGVLSGNRNFEGRIHPLTRANYLASPPLVIAYALAGTVDVDFETQPLGTNDEGAPVFLRDIWPTREEVQAVEKKYVVPGMFQDVYSKIQQGNERWNKLDAPESQLYPWDEKSTYIKSPPFFETMEKELKVFQGVDKAAVLLNFGDSVTTDHISPAGSIARNSPAAKYLAARGLVPRQFNSYGSRRGHDALMSRGTFANIRLVNKFVAKPGPRTVHHASGEEMDIFDAAMRYQTEGRAQIILAGKEYGSGSSRDWAAKGPWMLGVNAVLAESYERIHRSNLVGMGLIPLQYLDGENATSLGLTGKEDFTICLSDNLQPGQNVTVELSDGRSFQAKLRFDTEVELTYFQHGGILHYMVRTMV